MSSTPVLDAHRVGEELTRDPIVRALVEQLPVGVVIASSDGEIELANAVARDLFANHRHTPPAPELWVGPSADGEAGLEPIRWIIARALLTNEIVRDEEIEHLDAREEWRTLSVSATPVSGADGECRHAVVTFADVTERNRARDWEPVMRALSRL
jgi:PAS domain-containing protein